MNEFPSTQTIDPTAWIVMYGSDRLTRAYNQGNSWEQGLIEEYRDMEYPGFTVDCGLRLDFDVYPTTQALDIQLRYPGSKIAKLAYSFSEQEFVVVSIPFKLQKEYIAYLRVEPPKEPEPQKPLRRRLWELAFSGAWGTIAIMIFVFAAVFTFSVGKGAETRDAVFLAANVAVLSAFARLLCIETDDDFFC